MNQQEMEMAISQLNHRFLTEDLFTKEQYLIERKKVFQEDNLNSMSEI